MKRAVDAGKIMQKATKKSKRPSRRTQLRTVEMRELFQSDMSEKNKKKRSSAMGAKKIQEFI